MHKGSSPEQTASQIRKVSRDIPQLAIILGSGFASLTSAIAADVTVPYSKLPGFPLPAVPGHSGHLIIGYLAGIPVLLLSGRSHFYEGCSLAEVTFSVRVLAALGVKDLLFTNASGGINTKFRPGDLMLITDHINFLPENPLRGLRGTDKFLDLSQTYDPVLNQLLRRAARSARVRLHTGVYIALPGPSYETPAEIRAFGKLGADAVGMSTVPEAIMARFCGMRVAAISCITNFAAGRGKDLLSHAEVLTTGKRAAVAAGKLLKTFVAAYGKK